MARPSYDSDQPSPASIAAAVKKGDIAPIYCLSGERFLVDTAVAAIRAAVLAQAGAAAAFNHDTFDLKENGVGAAVGTARTLPMMAKRRLVIGKAIDEVKAADLGHCWLTSRTRTHPPASCCTATRSTCD